MRNGAQIVIEELKRAGVDCVFAYPGASILSIYDQLYKDSTIRHILPADERGAVFMADGYARSTGRTGVCFATSGPGATNLVTGIAGAFMDSVPMVIITGNVPLDLLGYDSFQEVDTTGITTPITKYNFIVKDVCDLARAVQEAFIIAQSGKKGPVLIDIPANILDETCEYTRSVIAPREKPPVNAEEIAAAAEIINNSKRPLIYAGGGVCAAEASALTERLSDKLNAPVGVSLMGIGAVPTSFDKYIGVGTSVNRLAKSILKKCDTIISLGARFSSKATTKTSYKKNINLVHLDIDRAEIHKILTAEGPVCGDLNDTLPILLQAVGQKDKSWLDEIGEMKKNVVEAKASHKKYIEVLNSHFGNEMTVTTDVGQHQLWTANYYKFDSPKKFLSSCGLGSMGYGLGAAVGAYFATGKPVLTITGDGSFNMSFNELITVKNYNIPVTVAIMNNGALGMVRENQKLNYGGRIIDADLPSIVDYKKLAEAYGLPSYTAKSPDELQNILNNLDKNSPAIIDCRVGKHEKSL